VAFPFTGTRVDHRRQRERDRHTRRRKAGDRTQPAYGQQYQDDLLKEIIPFVEAKAIS
jgi:hypothetical protein